MFIGSVSLTIYSVICVVNFAVPGTELGSTGEPMTHGTDLIAVLMQLTLPVYVVVERVYCEQEHAVGRILNYGEEDGILGKMLQRTPVPVGERRVTLPGRTDL